MAKTKRRAKARVVKKSGINKFRTYVIFLVVVLVVLAVLALYSTGCLDSILPSSFQSTQGSASWVGVGSVVVE